MKLMFNKIFKNYFLLTTTLFLTELIFRIVIGLSIVDWSVVRIFIGVNFIGLLFALLFSYCSRAVGNFLSFIVGLVFSVYSLIQAGFYKFLGTFVSFKLFSQYSVVSEFVPEYFSSLSIVSWVILIPSILLLLYYLFIDNKFRIMQMNHMIDFADRFDSDERKALNEKIKLKKVKKENVSDRVASVVFMFIFVGLYFATIIMPFMQNEYQFKSNKELIVNPDVTNVSVSQFGTIAYSLFDLKSTLLPSNSVVESSFKDGYVIQEQDINDFTRYIDNEVWEKIISEETNKNYLNLSNYYISQEITAKNDYTGIFEDKNLIVIMMDSVNNIAINEKYFPNLYKLYNEGWAWDNAYSPRSVCSTGDSEIIGMTSLYGINNNCLAISYKFNQYPHSLFNLFNDSGYITSSYHNYTDEYYPRSIVHANMGSGHYYGVGELGIPYSNVYKEWPSDVELMNKVLELTKDEEQFMAFVSTVSTHQPYDKISELGNIYLDLFNDTNYDISLKRYMSKMKVFDDSLGALLEGLEVQDKLDDTVIVLYSSHYPYGLKNSIVDNYFEYDVNENFEIDRTPFIIYNSKITAAKYDEYTTYVNIVPTIANLFDLEYDPRLYVGSDILSRTYENRIIFADGSWQDEKAFYNATEGTISYFNKGDIYTREEILDITTKVRDKIQMSNLAIRTNYFNYLYTKFDEYQVTAIEAE